MAIAMQMKWEGVTPEQYDKARKIVDMDGHYPEGMISHVAAFHDNAIRVSDVWETAEHFNTYVHDRLIAGTTAAGITGQPQVEIFPVHATLAKN